MRPRIGRTRRGVKVALWKVALWKTLEQWQRRAGLGASPRTILEELRRIQSTDIILPTTDGRDLRLRYVVRPDKAQAALLDRLGLDLPERLRIRPELARTAGIVVAIFRLSARFSVLDPLQVRKLG